MGPSALGKNAETISRLLHWKDNVSVEKIEHITEHIVGIKLYCITLILLLALLPVGYMLDSVTFCESTFSILR